MGCKELIESLRAAGDGKVHALRAEAEEEAARVRAEAARRIEEIRRSHEHEREAAAARRAEQVLAEAKAEARSIRMRAERTLAERLARLARASLSSLRNGGYAGVFASLVEELPRISWHSVRVNPADVELAQAHFAGAEIIPDAGISGGLIAASEGERVQVVNTLDVRLERSWEDLLPGLMQDVAEECR